MTRLFVDGAAGTVGLAVQPHLAQLQADGLLSDIIVLKESERKDAGRRAEAMAAADIVLLCLPDEVAEEAAKLVAKVNPRARVLDASAAHRCDDNWVYGLPEVTGKTEIRVAQRVANPGCFATGCILLGRPLAYRFKSALQTPTGKPCMAFQGVTGYSAGGSRAEVSAEMPYLTQLGTAHRHLPEIERHTGLAPTLTTIVGGWYQGMLVQATVPVPVAEVMEAYLEAYDGWFKHITVTQAGSGQRRLTAVSQNGTNDVHIMVGDQPYGTVVAAAFDNLGKGSAGAAADNLRLMLS